MCGEDVSFRDVKIKIPDRNWDQGIWVTSCTGSVGWDLRKSSELSSASEEEGWLLELGEARRICALRVLHVGWVESWRCKSSQCRKIVSLSPHVEKLFNSKVIKSFVPEPISWMSCISDSLRLFHTSVYHGYVTLYPHLDYIIIITFQLYYIVIIIIIIMSNHQHGYPWPSLATPLCRPWPPAGFQGYILYLHRAAVCRFELVILPLLGHVKGSTGVHHLWAHPYFSSSVPHVWFV